MDHYTFDIQHLEYDKYVLDISITSNYNTE